MNKTTVRRQLHIRYILVQKNPAGGTLDHSQMLSEVKHFVMRQTSIMFLVTLFIIENILLFSALYKDHVCKQTFNNITINIDL